MIVSGIIQQQREIMLIVLDRCCEKKIVDLCLRAHGGGGGPDLGAHLGELLRGVGMMIRLRVCCLS